MLIVLCFRIVRVSNVRQSKSRVPGSGRDGCSPGEWEVWLCLGEHLITRKAHPRRPLKNPYTEREEVIWPTSPATPAEEAAVAAMPLAALQKYWSKAGNRLRDSAKWMATVLGAAIAAVIGTTPLASLNGHHLQVAAALVGLAGLILLGVTLLLVLQVMRPEAVSYEDVQNALPLPEAARALPRQLRRFGLATVDWRIRSTAGKRPWSLTRTCISPAALHPLLIYATSWPLRKSP